MPSLGSRLRTFLLELKRRKVDRVTAGYAAGGFIVLQVAAILLPTFDAPEWSMRAVVIILLTGYPFAIGLAWVFDLTASGFERTEALDPGMRPLAVGRGALLLPAGLMIFSLALVAAMGWWLIRPSIADAAETGLAVLPFEASSMGGGEAEFFAEGLHGELLATLAEIGSLKVIARPSMREYRGTTKSLREIGRELGVATLLSGAVQFANDRVRLTVTLVDAESQEQLWSSSYEERLTPEQVFAIQSAVAREIATALNARITPAEAARVGQIPTSDLEAYNYYLRGMNAIGDLFTPTSLERAAEFFRAAVERDPTYIQAWARLSEVHSRLFGNFDGTEAQRRRALDAYRQAERLDPDAPEVTFARGLLAYYVHTDHERALEIFDGLRVRQPNNAEVLHLLGSLLRRRGRLAESQQVFRRAVELNPRSPSYHLEEGTNWTFWGRLHPDSSELAHRRALVSFERALQIDPVHLSAHLAVAHEYFLQGRLAAGDAALDSASLRIGSRPVLETLIDYEIRLRMLSLTRGPLRDSLATYALSGSRPDSAAYYLAKAGLFARRQDAARAAALYDSARVILERRHEERPTEPRHHGQLAVAYAGRGRCEQAIDEAHQALNLAPASNDVFSTGVWTVNLVRVLAECERWDEMIQVIRSSRGTPWGYRNEQLRTDPLFAPIRDDPRFRTLLPRR